MINTLDTKVLTLPLVRELIEECKSEDDNYIKINSKYDVDLHIKYVKDQKRLFIIFQGSSSWKDWLLDFSFIKKPYKRMDKLFFAHSGFLNAYHSIRQFIHSQLPRYEDVQYISIRGHSLGGALAELCYEDLKWHKEHNSDVYNFEIDGATTGAPRVWSILWGYKEIKNRMKNFIRIENKNDIVTRLPFSFLLFKHIGRKFRLGKRFWYPLLASAIYNHSHSSYVGRAGDIENYVDTEDNNPYYTTSVLSVYVYFYPILFCIIFLLFTLKIT